MNRPVFINAGIAALVALCTTLAVQKWVPNSSKILQVEHIESNVAQPALYTKNQEGELIPLDFTQTAERVMDGVVHIKVTRTASKRAQAGPNALEDFFGNSPFKEFFGPRMYLQPTPGNQPRPPVQIGQGSGVIISTDGYIVTNHHVIDGADDIEVMLHDNRSFKATVIGTDPSTDLALLQIRGDQFPALSMIDSDQVEIGEWVLAVGNPFNLNSTVTAGIVSAKGRNINILREQFAVESFIQTDAAINPGNSGGALVNLAGELIGINTAIASPTGAYSGYGFAVPSNIVSKVVKDLAEYGMVQRGVLGIMIRTVDGNLQKDKGLDITYGAYVDSLLENSAAESAGIQVGDIILQINETPVNSSPTLQEAIARYRPGDEINVLVNRNGKEKTFKVILNNRQGTAKLMAKAERTVLDILGITISDLNEQQTQKLGIQQGVQITKLYSGKLKSKTDIRNGFIITKMDGQPVKDTESFLEELTKKKGGVMLEGIYPDLTGTYYYAFGL